MRGVLHNRSDFAGLLRERLERQKRFFGSPNDGVLLYGPPTENFTRFITDRLHSVDIEEALEPKRAGELADEFLGKFRDGLERMYSYDADGLPWIQVYAGIGTVTGAMCGRPVTFGGGASWCEPNLDWDEIDELSFSPENPWVRFAAVFCRLFYERCRGEYLLCPYIHRSPLDAANGIRGTELFAELVLDSDRAKGLIGWCAEWSLALERYLAATVDFSPDMDRAVWSTWLPPGGVFVNGDPVGLISREMQPEFEGEYTGRLFGGAGAGFFHNHSMGLYQADLVSRTLGSHVQEFIPDLDRPHTVDILLHDEETMGRVREAACRIPVQIDGFPPDKVEPFLKAAQHGRYILNIGGAVTPQELAGIRAIVDRYPFF